MVITIILFLIIFTIMVVAHELGHFLLAKANGIRVKEFFVGMGPTLFHVKKGETVYSLKLLPLGGACVFDGEDGMDLKEGEAPKEGSFPAANVWARIATVIAGPIFNFILAYMFSLIIVAACGVTLPTIGSVTDGGAAQEAGLQAGDVITRVDGKRIHLFSEFSMYVGLNGGKELTVEYDRNGSRNTVTVTPIYDETDARYYIGIVSTQGAQAVKGLHLFQYSAYEVKYWVDLTFKSLGMLVTGQASIKDLGGPIAIAQTVGETYEATAPSGFVTVLLNMMNLVVLLSVNLGILNLLPLPALDGGRLLFLLIEVVRGKPVPPEKEGLVHFIGMAALLVLMVVVMYNDIMRLVTG